MRRSVWMRVLAAVLIISMLAAPVSAAARRPSPSYGTNCIVGGIISIIRDIIRDIWDDWFDVPGDEDPEPTPPEEPTDPTDPTEPGETEPEDPTEPEETLKTVLNLIEGHANTANGHLLRGVTYSLSQLAEEQSKPTPGSLRDIKAIAIGAARAAAPSAQLNAAVSSVQPMAEGDPVEITLNYGASHTITVDGDVSGDYSNAYVNVSTDVESETTTSTTANLANHTTGLSNGKYLLVSANYLYREANENRAVSTTPNANTRLTWTRADLNNIASDLIWTLEVSEPDANGSMTAKIKTPDGRCMAYASNVTLASDYTVTIERGTSNSYGNNLSNTWGIKFNINSKAYLNYSNVMGNWDFDEGSHWCFYKIDEETVTTSTTTITFTAASAGTTEIEIGGVIYRITVNPPPEEPEQPAIGSEVVFFPVTMFNYDHEIIKTATDAMDDNTAVREGLYFTGAGIDTGSLTYETIVDMSAFVAGRYYIQNIRASENNVNSWLKAHSDNKIHAEAQADATVWTLVIEDGKYYLTCDINGTTNYMKVGTNGDTDGYTTDKTAIEIVPYSRNAQGVQLKQNGYYLCQWGGNTALDFGGYGTNNDGGNGMRFYAVDAEGNVSDTPTTITSETTDKVVAGYLPYNVWAYHSDSNNAQNMFYSGLVEEYLDENNEIVFTVNEPGIFTFDKNEPSKTNDGLKDIYQYVGLPFVKNEKGYYTFDSDTHGTYFADTTNDGVSDPWYGAEDDFFNMYLDYQNTQGWENMNTEFGDGSFNLWAPYNTNANDTSSGAIDYHFGMRADIPFSMTPNGRIKSNDDNSEPITFTFKGDDDVWIFIDGQLVIDLGGIHNRLGATIDFANNTITYFLPESNNSDAEFGSFTNPEQFPLNDDGTITVKLYDDAAGPGALGQTRANFSTVVDHEMSIFYLERGRGTSNCMIEFNLPMLDTVLVTKDITHSWSAAADERDGENGDGTEKLTAKEQAAVDKLDFKFKLWKKEIGGRYTAVANTNYYLLDKEDNILGIYTTDAEGIFSLKNGQTAMFMTDLGNGTATYAVEELELDLDTFLTPDYKFAGIATNGFDFYGETLNNDTEDENDTKTVQKHLNDASLIGEQELPMDAAQLVSYDVTPYGSIEAIESLEFICTNYLNAELPNPTARAYEDIIVIDYGLPVQIDPLHNDLFRGENIEIVAWGDETLELNEVLEDNQIYAVPDGAEDGTSWSNNKVLAAAKVAANNNSYNDKLIDLADCLYTFKAVGDGCYEVSATTADGTKVYLNHYTSNTNEIPHDSIPGQIKIENGSIQNMFKLIAQVMDGGTGSARTLHFHTEQTVPYWNRCGGDSSHKCQEYLYRPAGKDDVSSTEIPGYVMVTSLGEIVDGGQYLIVHDKDANSTDDDMFVLHPSTSGDKYDHVAKLETTDVPAIGTSFSFDSGNVTFNDVTYAEHAHDITNADGTKTTTYTYTRDSFEYELTEQLTEVEEIRYIIKVNSTVEEEIGDETVTKTACRYALGKVYIVPATIMYYEENFEGLVSYATETGSLVGEQRAEAYVSPFQEPGVVGTVGDSTYGSDEAYECDPYDSNGTSYKLDTSNGYVRFAYSFTGTGTSFFARTSAKTGYMQVMLFDGELTVDEAVAAARLAEQKDIWYRDTFYNDTNNTNLDGESLYNIPVFTNNELHYGTYTILVTVAQAGTQGAGPNLESSGNEFYLDGIRVMQPLNESNNTVINEATGETITDKALSAYAADGESNLVVETLRQKLITDVEEGEAVWDGKNFVVLTDTNGAITAAQDYISYGPKEEVYLAPGQKVTFSMKYWEPQGLKVYMGMKAPFGTVGTDSVSSYSAKLNVGKNTFTLRNATDCYYDVTDMQEKLEAVYIQATDDNGKLLYTDANGSKIYMDDAGLYWYKETGAQYTGDEDELKPVNTTEVDYYVITYTFEATNSIVALTNIKVVGNFEFTIVEKNEENQEGPGTAEQ